MSWNYTSGRYQAQCGDYSLHAFLHPDMTIPTEENGLGSDEHPFVWFFEVYADDGVREFRGVRETLAEAQAAARSNLEQLLPDAVPMAEGF